jgi:hypothetical protein
MKAVILHDRIPPDANFDHQDVLYQSKAIANLLIELGYDPVEISVSLNLKELIKALRHEPFEVFNLLNHLKVRSPYSSYSSMLNYLKVSILVQNRTPFNVEQNHCKSFLSAGILTILPFA